MDHLHGLPPAESEFEKQMQARSEEVQASLLRFNVHRVAGLHQANFWTGPAGGQECNLIQDEQLDSQKGSADGPFQQSI